MNDLLKNLLSVILIFLLLSFLFSIFSKYPGERKTISLSELVSQINEGKVKEIAVSGDDVLVYFKDGSLALSKKEVETSLSQSLINLGVDKEKLKEIQIKVEKKEGTLSWLLPILYIISPVILFFVFLWFLSKQARTGANQIFDFTRAKPRLFGPGGQIKEKVTFNDIGGLKEAKEELKEVVDFLKNPRKYLELGAKIPRGVLLIGPPGSGKTLLAKAIACEAGVPFFSISGSEFVELFVGVGSARIRSLFQEARRAGRAIIFIDEIDSIGKIRGVGITGGHEEREQTLNQLLSEMDGIGREEGIVVLGSTNRPELLDPALLRPGRFDRRIVLDLPDIKEREEILKIHCRGKPLALNVNLREIAERTPGFSGADLANVVNEAAILAARRGKKQIFQEELLEAIDKVLLGPERKSHVLTRKEKEIAAYHEAGHAIVSAFLKEAEPVRKISIIPRGLAAGYTLKSPAEERRIKTKSEFLAEMATLLGGYCAEILKFGEISTGAANDLERATDLAKRLVMEYGMSSLGPITFGKKEELAFLGVREIYRDFSEKIAEKIDKEVEKFIKNAQNRAMGILKRKRKILENLAQKLIEKETIEREEFEKIIGKNSKKEEGSKKKEVGKLG
jgi:cell division protease FtsH